MFIPHKIAVIGAGTMGSQIAAHLANVGIPSLLLDVIPAKLTPEEQQAGLSLSDPQVRNRITQNQWDRALRLSPSPLYLSESSALVRIGNIEDHLGEIVDCDWILEAIVERLDAKHHIHTRIAKLARPDAILTSNTSGIPIRKIAEVLPKERRRRFFGSHFFNPPRSMRILELIPAPETDRNLMAEFTEFAESTLGKGVVWAKDSPGFISNRIGYFALQHAVWLTAQEGMGIDETDAITGPAMGRPRSATFRLSDLIGIDVVSQIGHNLLELLPSDEPQRAFFEQPHFVQTMIERGWLGEKKGQGFYKRACAEGRTEILSLDYQTLQYRHRCQPSFPSLDSAMKIKDPGERIRSLCQARDTAARFAWKHLRAVLCYSANCLPEIAEELVSIDRVLKWGFNWKLGPFEIWDALGVRETGKRLEEDGIPIPAPVKNLLAHGQDSFYGRNATQPVFFDFGSHQRRPIPTSVRAVSLPWIKSCGKILHANPGASVIDLGEGVACLEFHSKLNTTGMDQLAMMKHAREEVRRNFNGLVIGNQGTHFSAGADLGWLLSKIRNQEWEAIDAFLRVFQQATGSLRQFEKPIVVACHGYALGGGCEWALGAKHVVALAETYMGLPETQVGLVPAAGGCKEMLLRFTESENQGTAFAQVQQVWSQIFAAKISASAPEAVRLGYLRKNQTKIVMNADWLIGEARAKVVEIHKQGHRPCPPRKIRVLGKEGLLRFQEILQEKQKQNLISEHDRSVGTKLAWVLCGGDRPSSEITESQMLDLEREALLSLCGEVRTIERIEHMLRTGKALRN